MPIPQIKPTRLGVCILVALALALSAPQSFAFRWGHSYISPSDWHINFGGLQVGTTTTLPEVLTNGGAYPVTISSVSVTGGPFSLLGPSLPLTLDPGASAAFNVVFAPTSNADFSGSFNVAWGHYGRTLNIPVVATGTGTEAGPASLSAVPTAIGFGSVTVGSSATRTATLTASGSTAVISSITTTNPEFTISGVSLPLTLDAGSKASITVKFTPQSGGATSASLSFVSSDSGTLTSEALTGTGTAAAQHSVDLSWTDSTSDVDGYYIYRSQTSGGPYNRLTSNAEAVANYTDNGVDGGQTYYYVVTSVDSNGTESNYSREVAASVPAP